MPRVVFRSSLDAQEWVVDVPVGTRLLDAAAMAGAPVPTQCGGVMACLACRVDVAPASAVTATGKKESSCLSQLRAAPDTRLACQARAQRDVVVALLKQDDEAVDDPFSLDDPDA